MYALNLTMGNFIEAPTMQELKAEIRRQRWISGLKSDIWRTFRFWEDMQDFYITHEKHLLKHAVIHPARQESVNQEIESDFEIQDASTVYIAEFRLRIESAHTVEDTRRIIGAYHNRNTAEKELRNHIDAALHDYAVYEQLNRVESDYSNGIELSYYERKNDMALSVLGNVIEMTIW